MVITYIIAGKFCHFEAFTSVCDYGYDTTWSTVSIPYLVYVLLVNHVTAIDCVSMFAFSKFSNDHSDNHDAYE